jgi:predicted DNA-binding protein
MYDFENRDRNKTLTIRLSDEEFEKLNFLVETSGEKYKSDFIRKLILNEEVKIKKDFYFEEINNKLNKIIESLN